MTAKIQSTPSSTVSSPIVAVASPVLSTTTSSVASSGSPIAGQLSIHIPTVDIPDIDNCDRSYQHKQEGKPNHKRSFDYMNSNSDRNSMIYHDNDDQSIDSEDSEEKKSGRKLMIEEGFGDDDVDSKIKRKIQNRAAQRAFRERKERYVKELEQKIKYVQDSHIFTTTQLLQENQHLRSIIYHLELELGNFKGKSPDFPGNKPWLASIGPPPNIHHFQAVLPLPLPQLYSPLQIRPSPVSNKPRKIVPNIPEQQKKQKKPHTFDSDDNRSLQENFYNKSSSSTNTPSPSSPALSIATTVTATTENASGQQFTFSITTPATLRASSYSEIARKNEQIQVVQLYPDHSHPANCFLEKKKQQQHQQHEKKVDTPALSLEAQYSSGSIAGSVVSYSSSSFDEEEKTNGSDQELNELLRPFLDTNGNFDFDAFNSNKNQNHQEQDTSSSPALILNQLLEEANDSTTNWNIMNHMPR